MDERGINPLLRLLRKLGGFPLIDGSDWQEEKWSLNDITVKYPSIYHIYFYFEVTSNNVTVKSRLNKYFSDDLVRATLRGLSKNYLEIEEIIVARRKFNKCWLYNEGCQFPIDENEKPEKIVLVESVVSLKNQCDKNEKGCFNDLLPKDIDWSVKEGYFDANTIFRLWRLLLTTPKR